MEKVILLVEDDPDDALLIRRALGASNVKNAVVTVRDGPEALDYLFATGAWTGRGESDAPVVVLLDLHIPKIDGLEVLRRVRANERTRLQPVVMLTSSKEEQDRLRSYGLGANSFVQKPVDFARFSEAVRQLGLYWTLINEPPPVPQTAKRGGAAQ